MRIEFLRHATMVVSMAGKRILVDPMLGPAGDMPPIPDTPNPQRNPLVPLPAILDELVAGTDAALITHTHRDHFDPVAGTILPKDLPLLIQPEDTERLLGLEFSQLLPVDISRAWRGIELIRTVARHGHGELAEQMAPASGFLLRSPGEPTLYIAGDSVWCDEVRQVLETYEPSVVVVNAGAAQFLTGDPITMTAEDVANVCAAAPLATVVAVHMEAINHCLLTREELHRFLDSQDLATSVLIPADGETLRFPVQ
jgi:L-ascorbate metabolism protein UlaG (beta-lactamase superfamily)